MNILTAFFALCELVFAGSIIFVRLADPVKSREFFSEHRILAGFWVITAIIGFFVFFTTGILKIGGCSGQSNLHN